MEPFLNQSYKVKSVRYLNTSGETVERVFVMQPPYIRDASSRNNLRRPNVS